MRASPISTISLSVLPEPSMAALVSTLGDFEREDRSTDCHSLHERKKEVHAKKA